MIELGKHYRTRDGKYRTDNDTLRVLMVDGGRCTGMSVLVVHKESDGEWFAGWRFADGREDKLDETEFDLIEIKPRRKGEVWVNCYPEGTPHLHTFYYDRETADEYARESRIACVCRPFEYEEGEGL